MNDCRFSHYSNFFFRNCWWDCKMELQISVKCEIFKSIDPEKSTFSVSCHLEAKRRSKGNLNSTDLIIKTNNSHLLKTYSEIKSNTQIDHVFLLVPSQTCVFVKLSRFSGIRTRKTVFWDNSVKTTFSVVFYQLTGSKQMLYRSASAI